MRKVGTRPGFGGREQGAGWWAVPGLAVLLLGVWVLLRDVEFWNVVWYVPAWYGYLLVLDAFLHKIRGHSFLSRRRGELGAMMFWSLPFWFFAEAYNLVLQNWYYVFVPRSSLFNLFFSALCYATVLPACFYHAEVLRVLGCFRDLRWRPLRVGRGTRGVWLTLGIASVVAPLVWPRYAFPLVWGALLWIPDLVNYRVGAPSLLRDLEAGRGGRLARLLLGGLWAGFMWELFNYWARCKWVYTVPGFEEWKLFEMPVLGFLGFPVFAVEGFAFYALVSHFLRGGRSWEGAGGDRARPVPRRARAVAAFLAAAFSLAVYGLAFDYEPYARRHEPRPLLTALEGIDSKSSERLRDAGLPTPERLFAAVNEEGAEALARRLGLDPREIERAGRHAALALHKGMGTEKASLLLRAGIEEVGDLAARDAGALVAELATIAVDAGVSPPRPAMVEVWVRASRWNGKTWR